MFIDTVFVLWWVIYCEATVTSPEQGKSCLAKICVVHFVVKMDTLLINSSDTMRFVSALPKKKKEFCFLCRSSFFFCLQGTKLMRVIYIILVFGSFNTSHFHLLL